MDALTARRTAPIIPAFARYVNAELAARPEFVLVGDLAITQSEPERETPRDLRCVHDGGSARRA